jgi:hypothetical protein
MIETGISYFFSCVPAAEDAAEAERSGSKSTSAQTAELV